MVLYPYPQTWLNSQAGSLNFGFDWTLNSVLDLLFKEDFE